MSTWVSSAASAIVGGAISAVSAIAGSAASAVVEKIVDSGMSYLSNRMLPADSDAELKRLSTALPQIREVMGLAEALKAKDPSSSEWFEQFRKAVDASEDVLDDLEYKKLEDMVKNRDEPCGSASRSKKQKSCPINEDTLRRLRDAVTMLDQATANVEHLCRRAAELGIHYLAESRQVAIKVLRRETSSIPVERKVFGRDVEKNKVISWLKQPTEELMSSFGIVGMGGLGKTTLAQFAYQEMKGSTYFDQTIWVSVSIDFSVKGITKKILSELGNDNCGDKSLNALQEALKEKIQSRKILLVLDDIRDDENLMGWEQFVAPLKYVKQGSKILFTARMQSVVNFLGKVVKVECGSLKLQGLGEQDLGPLFDSYAFHGINRDDHGDLQAIGDQIIKMLKGSPLAAKVIGSLLNSCPNHQFWSRMSNRDSFFNIEEAKDVMEVLKLSYYHLPTNLQVCFRFCSIFPQDHEFDKDKLIRMWMAAGFLCQSSGQKRPEDIGEDYFNHLLRKSFFETSQSREGNICYVMHDLMHELAQNVATGECCRMEPNEEVVTIPNSVRHISVHESEIERVYHLENLRSLVITTNRNLHDPFVFPNELMKKKLRLLVIYGQRRCELPEEMSCLVQLRYLSIRLVFCSQSFKYLLHASIYKLYHLQVLELLEYLPASSYVEIETSGITNLINLRYMRLPKKIMRTICGVHKLKSLQQLEFFVGKENGQHINELGTLNDLRYLSICDIENVGDPIDARGTNLFEKKNLMSLSLEWSNFGPNPNNEQIISNLQPHSDLKFLTISGYTGRKPRGWSPLINLSSLKLHYCPNLDEFLDIPLSLIEFCVFKVGLRCLPNFHQFSTNSTISTMSQKSSLRKVEISNCSNLISLDGFLGQGNINLQAVEFLSIKNCQILAELPIQGFGNLTSLKKLELLNCPKLAAMDNQNNLLPMNLESLEISNCGEFDVPLLKSASHLTSLTKLKISDCTNIAHIPCSQNSFGSLSKLYIEKCDNLVQLSSREQARGVNLHESSLASLKINDLKIDHLSLVLIEPLRSLQFVHTLEVSNCSEMEALPEQWLLENRSTLRSLTINGGRTLKSLPSSMASLTALTYLYIEGASSLKSLPSSMASLTALERLYITNANLLEKIPELPTSLTYLVIQDANSLKSLPSSMASLTALQSLSITDAYLLEELPQLPASLKFLDINGTNSLKSLPSSMASLTALERLSITDAYLLEELPQLPASLTYLIINGAKSLKSLPSTMANLTTLKHLDITNADLLEELPVLPLSLRWKSISRSDGVKLLK